MYSSENCKKGKEKVEKKVNFQLEDSSLAGGGPLHNSAIFSGIFSSNSLFRQGLAAARSSLSSTVQVVLKLSS